MHSLTFTDAQIDFNDTQFVQNYITLKQSMHSAKLNMPDQSKSVKSVDLRVECGS